MIRFRTRAAVAVTTAALFAAGGTAVFTLQSASAAPTDDPPPATSPPTPDGNSPGTGGDAYKSDDPFVDHGNKPKKIAANTIVAQSFQLFPGKLTTTPGHKIVFDNQDIAIHNIQTLKGKVKVKSPDAQPGKKVAFKAPKKAGIYNVGCYYHQSMVMKLIVKKK